MADESTVSNTEDDYIYNVSQLEKNGTIYTIKDATARNSIANLANVATSGEYSDLLNKPTIPAAQVQSDWNATTGMGVILNKPTLATVATSGEYSDLLNKPTIPVIDQSYSGTSVNAQSGVAVKSAIDSAISSVYKPAGSVAFANLPTPASTNLGNVYNMTDSFTTDSRFVEGSGKTYPAGTNVVIISSTGVKNTTYYCYYYDVDGVTQGPYYLLNSIPSVGDNIYSISNGVATKTKVSVSSVSNNQITGIVEKFSQYPILEPIPRYPTNDVTLQETSDGYDYFFDVLSGFIDLSGYATTNSLSNVATSGEYSDLLNKPTIPAAQVQSDWNATSGMGVILNKPTWTYNSTTETLTWGSSQSSGGDYGQGDEPQ